MGKNGRSRRKAKELDPEVQTPERRVAYLDSAPSVDGIAHFPVAQRPTKQPSVGARIKGA